MIHLHYLRKVTGGSGKKPGRGGYERPRAWKVRRQLEKKKKNVRGEADSGRKGGGVCSLSSRLELPFPPASAYVQGSLQ